ncbi:unnamed protein product, partial [Laminaria digitata]
YRVASSPLEAASAGPMRNDWVFISYNVNQKYKHIHVSPAAFMGKLGWAIPCRGVYCTALKLPLPISSRIIGYAVKEPRLFHRFGSLADFGKTCPPLRPRITWCPLPMYVGRFMVVP